LGVKERQEREREAVSRAILDAARDLFVAEGYQKRLDPEGSPTASNTARLADLQLLPSKDDIFFALAEEGFALLFAGDLHEPCHRRQRAYDPDRLR
jgi:AcrR family transcriptional regulator